MQSFIQSLIKGFNTLISSPLSMAALALLFIAILGIIIFKRIKLTPLMISLTGVTLALSFILNNIKFMQMPQSGSVTLGGMIPIILLALIFGTEIGLLAGFLFGLLNLLTNPYILHPIQVLFDYPLPFMMLGLAGLVKLKNTYDLNNLKLKVVAVTLAIFGRFTFHWLSGVIFFAEYAPENMHPAIYSLVYNGTYLLVEYIIAVIIIGLIPVGSIAKRLRRNIV